MAIATILDPMCKIKVVEFSFPKFYHDREARENIVKILDALYEIYEEYVREYQYSQIKNLKYVFIDHKNVFELRLKTLILKRDFSDDQSYLYKKIIDYFLFFKTLNDKLHLYKKVTIL